MNASGKWLVIGAIVLVAVGAGGVLISSKPKTQKLKIEVPVVASPTPEAVSGDVVEAPVEGSSYKFSPSKITALRGDTVRLTFKSTGGIHNLVIDQFGVETSQLGDGEEEEVEFVVDKMGTFEYYCAMANHQTMGMIGKLVVGGE